LSATPADRVELTEDDIPLDGIRDHAAELIELFGGEIASSSDEAIDFTLPSRRGIAASGSVTCRLSWSRAESGEGVVKMLADREVASPRRPRTALLVAGAIGGVVCLMWPFFPGLGPAAALGGLIAFTAYFLTLRQPSAGLAWDLLQRIATAQREAAAEAEGS
jgi:hypothetical protein